MRKKQDVFNPPVKNAALFVIIIVGLKCSFSGQKLTAKTNRLIVLEVKSK